MTKNAAVYAGLAAQYYTAKASNDTKRFLGEYNVQNPGQVVFGIKYMPV